MKTEIITITDCSASMTSIQRATVAGYNEFISEQMKQLGEARVTDVRFHSRVWNEFVARPLSDVPPFHFYPQEMTALNDAIGKTLEHQGKRIADEKWADLVIVMILTDGGENVSQEYTAARVKEMTEHAQKHGWKFVYVGANQDAFKVAANYGFDPKLVANFGANAIGTKSAYAGVSASTTSLRAGVSPVGSLQNMVVPK